MIHNFFIYKIRIKLPHLAYLMGQCGGKTVEGKWKHSVTLKSRPQQALDYKAHEVAL